MWLVDLNYSFECDWLIELSNNKLSNNKLSDNNLASELVKNRSFLNQSQSSKLKFLWLGTGEKVQGGGGGWAGAFRNVVVRKHMTHPFQLEQTEWPTHP